MKWKKVLHYLPRRMKSLSLLSDVFPSSSFGMFGKGDQGFIVAYIVFRYSATKATVIAIVCSFFSIFDIPVFWPILLVYFCILFAITMRRQIKHMIKYRYIPFDWGKKNYGPSSSRSRWSTHLFSLWIAYKCIITAADIGMSIHRYNKTYKYSKVYCYIMDHAEHRLFAEKCQCQFTVIWLFLP